MSGTEQDLMENDLIRRVLAGEQEAFSPLVKEHQRSIYYLIYRIVQDEEAAKDLTQESFVKAYQSLKSFKMKSSFSTWLYRIAVNTAKNYLRERSRRPMGADNGEEELLAIPDEKPGSLEDQIKREEWEKVQKAVASLPEKQRITLILKVYEEKSFEEVAQIMNSPVGTAKANYHHAMENLKKRMKHHEK